MSEVAQALAGSYPTEDMGVAGSALATSINIIISFVSPSFQSTALCTVIAQFCFPIESPTTFCDSEPWAKGLLPENATNQPSSPLGPRPTFTPVPSRELVSSFLSCHVRLWREKKRSFENPFAFNVSRWWKKQWIHITHTAESHANVQFCLKVDAFSR